MARREQEHTQLPMPNGWFAVDWSHQLREGDVKPLHYFGEELVLFRSRSGQARVLDAFCAHMGAHLGHGGRVVGETLRCPFHGWQYDGASGQCAHIPYCDQIPPRALLRSWDVQEKNGLVFVWYHVEGKPPEWDFPAIPEIGHEDWSEPRTFEREFPTHVQETHENNNDPIHFQIVHGMPDTPRTEIEYSEDRRHYRIVTHSEIQTPAGSFQTSLVRDSWGLGLTGIRMLGFPSAGLLMYSSTIPIDEKRVYTRWLLTATKNMVDVAGEEFMKNMTTGVEQDLPIWKHKVHRARPVLCKADTLLAEFRQWARQFYSEPVE